MTDVTSPSFAAVTDFSPCLRIDATANENFSCQSIQVDNCQVVFYCLIEREFVTIVSCVFLNKNERLDDKNKCS